MQIGVEVKIKKKPYWPKTEKTKSNENLFITKTSKTKKNFKKLNPELMLFFFFQSGFKMRKF